MLKKMMLIINGKGLINFIEKMDELKQLLKQMLIKESKRHNNKYEINPLFNNEYGNYIEVSTIRQSYTIRIVGLKHDFRYQNNELDKIIQKYFKHIIITLREDLNHPFYAGVNVNIGKISIQTDIDSYELNTEKHHDIIICSFYEVIYDDKITQFMHLSPCGRYLTQSNNLISIFRQPKRCLFDLMNNDIDIYEEYFILNDPSRTLFEMMFRDVEYYLQQTYQKIKNNKRQRVD